MGTEMTSLIHYAFKQGLNIASLSCNHLFGGKGRWDLDEDPTLQ